MRSVPLNVASLFEKAAGYTAAFRNSVGERPQRPEQTYPEALKVSRSQHLRTAPLPS